MIVLSRKSEPKRRVIRYYSISPLELLLYVFIVFLINFSCSEDKRDKVCPASFRGIRWGTKITDLQNMVLIDSRDQMKAYTRRSDELRIGSAQIKSVIYLFYEDRFSGILIEYNGLNNHKRIKDVYYGKYGEPNKMDEQEGIFQWIWPGEVMMLIKYNKQGGTGNIVYSYIPLLYERGGAPYRFNN